MSKTEKFSNKIATSSLATLLSEIKNMTWLDELLKMLKQIDALKVALDAADTFFSQSVLYAKLEADALVRVCELGGLGKLRGTRRNAAEWLWKMDEQERQKTISLCEDGITIENIYKREVGDEIKTKKCLEQAEYERGWLLDSIKETGICDLKPFANRVRESFKFDKRNIAEDIIDGTRNRLRKLGAVGIGEDSGIYVLPTADNKDEVKKAILLRYDSIANDLRNIAEIAKKADAKLSYKDFDIDIYHAERHGYGYMVHILISLARIGLISDEDEMYTEFGRSEAYEEMKFITKHLGDGKERAVTIMYENLKSAHTETA